MENGKLRKKIEKLAYGSGASLFGVADIRGLKKEFHFSDEILTHFDYAISIGLRLSDAILEEIKGIPTRLYYYHYRQVNASLDQLALKLAGFLQSEGYSALPVPASQIVDWEKQEGHVSHKRIGELAGLGFIGRNNLLVNPELGARFRLVTVLTDASMDLDRPLGIDCGECRVCIDACPAGAIKENFREFEHVACYKKLKEFKDKSMVSQFICGVCVKACRGKICKKIQ
ncbi:MAG: hypothetical protein KKH08_00340 [Candidatus Omnitrophica bacterium]|nr:hypothetical protein [Candidatus Omnitrophota bacterium]